MLHNKMYVADVYFNPPYQWRDRKNIAHSVTYE